MVYGSIEGVKNWLPEVSGSAFDSELGRCLEAASSQADVLIKRRVNPDLLPASVKSDIAKAVELLAAGLFRMKRQKGEQQYVEAALNWLNSILDQLSRFEKTGFKK